MDKKALRSPEEGHNTAPQRLQNAQRSRRAGSYQAGVTETIRQAFSSRVTLQRKALIGALNLIYWLAKQEVAHTTKFNSLKDLAIQLGCDYLRELSLGRNAQYSSEQIISELLQCLRL